ncbi:MAG: class D beta-lactamase [Moraxellaceae bacterium]
MNKLRWTQPLRIAVLALSLCGSVITLAATQTPTPNAPTIQLKPDWANFFDAAQVDGTIIILDERTQPATQFVYQPARAATRYSPASTFKIPHTLFALDAGVVLDAEQVFKWDGVPRSFAGHNQDQTLQTAMRNSTVWVYEGLAKQIGTAREQHYLHRIRYGNQNASGAVDQFWLNGTLKISAQEQLLFLQQLHREQLPFSVAHQRLVKQLIRVDSGQDWSLHAKTGWSGSLGWWVGWVQQPTGAVFFALNIDTPQRMADLPKRESITRAILREIAALPAAPKP